MATYYYVPPFVDGDITHLGEDSDGAIVYSVPPASSRALKFDGVRFVLETPDGTPSRAGWTVKTVAEVEADYPGLIGGG